MADFGRGHLLDTRPLTTSPAFARLWIGSTLSGLGGQLTIVAIMLQMYAITHSTFAVAMIAVAGLVPMVFAGIYGGMLADAFDRRTVALLAALVTFASTLWLAILTWTGHESAVWLFIISVVNSSANSIVGSARSAITPRLIPRHLLPAAAALQGITVGIMVLVGPALAGILVASTGYVWTYTIDVLLMSSLFLGLWTLPRIRPEGETVRPGLQSLRDGWQFLKGASNIRLQYILDVTAMTFGQPLALFPAIGAVLLGGGAITTGALTAAVALGAFGSSLFSGRISQVRHHGIGIQRAIQVYGGSIALFGLVLVAAAAGWFAPSHVGPSDPNIVLIVFGCIALVISGASDNVSAIYRSTMMQAAAPDAIRGRLQGIFQVVVAGGPRIGALYAGLLATWTTLWFPPLIGGFIIIGLVTVLVRRSPRFRAYDAEHPDP